MKVYYRVELKDKEPPGWARETWYEAMGRIWEEDVEFCCDEMADAWKEGFVGFGHIYDVSGSKGTWATANIYRCYPYPEGVFWHAMPIKRCPWCGEPIELVRKEN